MSIPFTVYDFFAYLSTGSLWLIGIDYAFATGWILGKPLGPAETALLVILAYVIGHVNSHWAAWLLENRVIGEGLGYPTKHLFAASARGGPLRHYFEPLPKETAKAVLDKCARFSGPTEPGNAMFIFCFNIAKERSAVAYGRLETFLNLYGFARNMSFAALLLTGVFIGAAAVRPIPHLWLLALAALVTAITLFDRYLKFFRLFSVEVFTTLLALPEPDSLNPKAKGVPPPG